MASRGQKLLRVEQYTIKSDTSPYNSDTAFRTGQAMILHDGATVKKKTDHAVRSIGFVVDDTTFTSGDTGKVIDLCVDGDILVTAGAAIAVNTEVQINTTTGKVAAVTPEATGDTLVFADGYLIEAAAADGDKVLMRIAPRQFVYTSV